MAELYGPGSLVPPAAERYLQRAVAPEASHIRTAELHMHGEIRIGRRWASFTAVENLAPLQGFDWQAEVSLGPVRMSGFDRLLQGHGQMRWRLFGLIPAIQASGADIDRSAAGRLAAESIWLPSALTEPSVVWSEKPDGWVHARWSIGEHEVEIALDLDTKGLPKAVRETRWGDPDGTFGEYSFGGLVEETKTFHGLTIPTRMRAGWHFGTDRFEEGEFFRVVVDDLKPGPALFRPR